MPSYNKVILMGNLTRDPELKYTQSGTELCNFGVAINEGYKDKNTGQRVDSTVFVECTAWGQKAVFISEYFAKGRPVHIEGKLKFESWEDKQSGQKRQKLSVMVLDATFCESKGQKPEQGNDDGPPDDFR